MKLIIQPGSFIGTHRWLLCFVCLMVFKCTLATPSEHNIADTAAVDIIRKAEIDSNRIKEHIGFLSAGVRQSRANLKHLDSSMEFIIGKFKAEGLDVSTQPVSKGKIKGNNIIGKIRGTASTDSILVVCAHYDTVWMSPGADDNASGVAALIELAGILSKIPIKKTVWLVATDMEEDGMVGSRFLAVENKDKIAAAINLDMIGYATETPGSQQFPRQLKENYAAIHDRLQAEGMKANFILNFSNANSAALRNAFDSLSRQYVPGMKTVTLEVTDDGKQFPWLFRASDHVSFWDQGIPAISVGDTAGLRNGGYHSRKDHMTALNYEFLTGVIRATLATVLAHSGDLTN